MAALLRPPLGVTRSLEAVPPEPDTEAATAGRTTDQATLDSPSAGRGDGFSFLLNSRPVDSQTTLPPGAEEPESKVPRVAGYEILGVLGEGGMGIVYKAKQARLDRFVALKMIRAGAARGLKTSRGSRPRPRRSRRSSIPISSASSRSVNTAACRTARSNSSPAAPSPRRSAANRWPAREAARIAELLARAIAVAHKAGIIHRDLKPANVLLAADRTPKITDFGLVKRLEDDSSHTRTGSILGTPSYMSPEQARGETHKIGPAADQYALGAILYELLTGRPPFQGVSVLDTLDQVRKSEPVPPSQLQPKMPRDIETICLKCLQKDPARRYPDVTALADDLESVPAR